MFQISSKNALLSKPPSVLQVIPNLWAVHNDPDVWENPSEFKPSRHISANGDFVPNRKIIPFSAGARNCLGATLARMEVFMFIVGLLQKFEVLPNPDPDNVPFMDELPGFINSPMPYHFVFRAR